MSMTEHKPLIEKRLGELVRGEDRLHEAMSYSLLAPGKRLRPLLLLEFCRLCGGDTDAALDAACAVEMLHTYSLIHDDMPCMDDDDLRRGLPTNHIVYGEWLAMLAGDALQAEAFSAVLNAPLPYDRRCRAAQLLAAAAGAEGICMGQFLDLDGEGKSLREDEIDLLNMKKTSALIEAACAMGCVCAGRGEKERDAKAFGAALGRAFQLRDDLMDIELSSEQMGKNAGSDERNGKATLVSLLGAARCREIIRGATEEAAGILRRSFPGSEELEQLTLSLAERKN
ncbi:MAG: polyprenyl synthetase family protein [Oscillospiraceae bacterium]|nr:polyprenyl synthetase family protein [Oscillospiraceae bacterium]